MERNDIKTYIEATRPLLEAYALFDTIASKQPIDVVEETVEPTMDYNPIILEELEEISFKLKSFMESETGDYALGVETGMQRAAEMIDNVIRRYRTNSED